VDGDAVRVDVDADVVADGLTVTAVSERAHAAD
jgi:ATP-dependent Clp protease ATP-binding subunit ClpB